MPRVTRTSISLTLACVLMVGSSGCSDQQTDASTNQSNLPAETSHIQIQDARGRTVTLEHPAIRVISLLPSLTEFIFELDKGHLLIGRTNWCRYPKEALDVPIVGGLENPVVETLVRLNPDLILAGPFLRNEQVNHLESLGLTVATFDHQDWNTVVRDLTLLGTLLDNPGDVKTLISWLEKQRRSVKIEIEESGTSAPIKTAMLYALEPLYTSGAGTFVDEMINLAGGVNIAASLSSRWPMLSMEGLLQKQPEVLLISTEAGTPDTLAQKIRELSEDEVWKQLTAIKNNRVYLLDGDPLAVPGTRQIKALRQIAAAIHPELFEAPPGLVHVNLLKRPRIP